MSARTVDLSPSNTTCTLTFSGQQPIAFLVGSGGAGSSDERGGGSTATAKAHLNHVQSGVAFNVHLNTSDASDGVSSLDDGADIYVQDASGQTGGLAANSIGDIFTKDGADGGNNGFQNGGDFSNGGSGAGVSTETTSANPGQDGDAATQSRAPGASVGGGDGGSDTSDAQAIGGDATAPGAGGGGGSGASGGKGGDAHARVDYFNVPDVPTNLTGTPVSTSRNDITFSIPAYADDIEAEISTHADFAGASPSSIGLVTSHSFTGLQAGTSYHIRVRAVDTVAGASSYSASISKTTQSPVRSHFGLGIGIGIGI
jgi:hypothetical protein